MGPAAELAVIGGSGLYELLDDAEQHHVATPYGTPSGPVTVATIGGRGVAFLARHGPGHEHPPHRIPYRANLWALHQLGVRRVLAPCAAGSLQPHVHPGDVVVLDQLVDRTWGRPDTYFDGPGVNHVAFADPYCGELGEAAAGAVERAGMGVHRGGTVVVVQGPRFSTRAESRWFRAQGWEVVNMTQHPEAVLAAELGMCYSALALITDYDTGVDDDDSIEAVSQAEVFRFFAENVERLRAVLLDAVTAVADAPWCRCGERANGVLPSVPPATDTLPSPGIDAEP